jgi:hypothetical protein
MRQKKKNQVAKDNLVLFCFYGFQTRKYKIPDKAMKPFIDP